jgi:hypothetical protein
MIVIHIGLKKSGSASIQSFFAANDEALRTLSIDYPALGRLDRKDHHNFASEIMGRKNFDPKYGGVSHLGDYLRATPYRTTIISSEMFEGFDVDKVGRLRAGLADLDQPIKIVLVLRDLVELLQSSYAQKIRNGRNTYNFDEFFESRMKETRVTYFETARTWAAVFGWDSLIVRLLDPRYMANGDLLDDFLQAIAIDADDPAIRALPRPGLVNTANGWKILEAVRALYGGRHGLPGSHPLSTFIAGSRRKFDQKLMDQAAAEVGERHGWMADKGAYLSRAQAQDALDTYVGSILQLNEHLAEKLPLPQTLDERGFVDRAFVPDAKHIPATQLGAFYRDLGGWFVEHQGEKAASKQRKRYSRNLRQDRLTLGDTTVRLSTIDAMVTEFIDEPDARVAAVALGNQRRGTARLAVLIEDQDFLTRGDRDDIAGHVRQAAGLDSLEAHFVPPRFLSKNSLNKVDRVVSARHWLEYRAGGPPDAEAETSGPRSLRIVSLADGRNLRGLTAAHFETLSARLGAPVHFEQMSLPPCPILLSDAVFLDYFAGRADDAEASRAVSRTMRTLRGADIILVDDGAELYFPMAQSYPVLSHRLKRAPDADLLALRRNRYVQFHHRLPVAVVNGATLSMVERQDAIDTFSDYIGAPIFTIASSRALERYTEDWDYRPLQSPSSGGALVPMDPDALVDALGDWILAKARVGAISLPDGPAGVEIIKPVDPPYFSTQPVDRAALERVLDSYGRFCIAGLPASVAFIPKYLEAVGKTYFYTPNLRPETLRRLGDFDCVIACGHMGPAPETHPAVALMVAGWPAPSHNVPSSLASLRFRGKLAPCRGGEWYSVTARGAGVSKEEREAIFSASASG